MSQPWSNLAQIVFRRTYSRSDFGALENWEQTIDRAIVGNVRGKNVPEEEVKQLLRLGYERKAIPAGRGLWFSGAPAHERIGGAALTNCWFMTAANWEHFPIAQDLLMLGGGVGMSVEHRFVSKLPKVKENVVVTYKNTRDADYIVPDSREGWCALTRRALKAFFVTGRSFSYSTTCLRGAGERIEGFGGISSGPLALVKFIQILSDILAKRAGRHIRPIDASDLMTATGEMVVAGNVRRSAILIQGDPWDKEFLRMKRWDLGTLPSHRSCANYSVVVEDVDDLHPLFWQTFDNGEAFGIVNRKAIQKYGRMGELKHDPAEGVNPCGEATLEPFEPCNLQELALPNIENEDELVLAARLMHRYGKRVSLEQYHHPQSQAVIVKNRRIGTGITGCLASPLFNSTSLDRAYKAIQQENKSYSKELGIPESIRKTVVKPSGTVSKVLDMGGYEGIHPAYSRYIIQRVRFASTDSLIPLLHAAGHHIEPVKRLDGTLDHGTSVVDFYIEAPKGTPVADEDFDTWKQLSIAMFAQKWWADQAVSTSVYYKREDIPRLKIWLRDNLNSLKTISFLAHSEHGFVQAPKEAITQEQYEQFSAKIKPLDLEQIGSGSLELQECEGACPTK